RLRLRTQHVHDRGRGGDARQAPLHELPPADPWLHPFSPREDAAHVTPGRRERSSVLAYALVGETTEVSMSDRQKALEALAAAQWKLALRVPAAFRGVSFGLLLLW